MVNHLGYARDEAVTEATKLYISHGTTLAGLVERGTPVDFELWHREVHWGHVPYKELLHPDPGLHKILTAMDLPKYVFTNADKYVTGWLKFVTVYMCDFCVGIQVFGQDHHLSYSPTCTGSTRGYAWVC